MKNICVESIKPLSISLKKADNIKLIGFKEESAKYEKEDVFLLLDNGDNVCFDDGSRVIIGSKRIKKK